MHQTDLTYILALCAIMASSPARAEAQLVFGVATRLDAPLSSGGADFGAFITTDDQSLYFQVCPSFSSDCDIHVATRNDGSQLFDPPTMLQPDFDTSTNELYPTLSPQGLELFFADAVFAPFDNNLRRPGGEGGGDLWMATRAATDQAFGDVTNQLGANVNTSNLEAYPRISRDGLTLLFASDRSGGQGGGDLWMATREQSDGPFGDVTNLGAAVNSAWNEGAASMSTDGLTLIFDSNRPGGMGGFDLWMATRTNPAEPFGNVVNLGPNVNSATLDSGPNLSGDGSTLYFESLRAPNLGLGSDLWSVAVESIPEPSSISLISVGLLAVLWRRTRG